jgi:hypothetical protein
LAFRKYIGLASQIVHKDIILAYGNAKVMSQFTNHFNTTLIYCTVEINDRFGIYSFPDCLREDIKGDKAFRVFLFLRFSLIIIH